MKLLVSKHLTCCKFYFASLLTVVCLMALAPNLYAQSGRVRVTGKVVDETSRPIIGVTVVVAGTGNGTTTTTDGTYQIDAPANSSLCFSFLGYESQTVAIGSKTVVDVVMAMSTEKIEDVVVVGYGTQKKVNLTGAVSTINKSELTGKPTINIVESIQGTTPGLIIEQSNSAPGSRPSINIRGLNTMNDNSPLILIDGIVGDIQNVAATDIEQISVLKDASSTAIYGSRASNGVILITTSKGRSGHTEVSYNFQYGVQDATCMPKVLDSWIYCELRNEALVNSGLSTKFTNEQIAEYKNGGTNCKWLEELYRVAPQQQHNLSVTGGNDRTTYLMSAGYLNQESMFKGNYNMKRYNARLNISHKLYDNLTVTATAAYTNNEITDHAYWTDWIIEQCTRMPSIYSIKNQDGTYNYPSGSNSNSLERLEKGGYRRSLNDDLSGTFTADLKIIDGLHLKGMVGGQLYINSTHENRKASTNPLSGDQTNQISENQYRTTDLTSNLMLTYDKHFGRHTFGAIAGYSYEGERYRYFATSRQYDQNKYDILGSSTSGDKVSNEGNGNAWALYSVFGRLTYNYDEKYLLEFNIRNDSSSRFKKGNRSALFPSVSGAWRMSQEEFWGSLSNFIPSAKLRASWGLVGNNRISLYSYMANVGTSNGYVFGGQTVNTAWFGSSNPDLKWETTRMADIGLDLDLLPKGNLKLSFDYFHNMTRDILVNLPVSGLFGGGEPIQNAGKVKTYGWEVALAYDFKTGSVNHRLSANMSDSQNMVVDTKGTETIGGYDVNTIIKEGYPLWSYYAYRSDGFFQNQDEVDKGPHLDGVTPKPGDIRYLDKNNDNVIKEDDDRFIVGNRYPRYLYGFGYSMNWNGFDFSMFWQGVGRRSVWLRGESVEAFHNNNEGPVFDFHLDRWTPTNTDATYPRLTVGSESTNNAAKSDFWIQDASYLRLKNLQIGYTFPNSWMQKIWVKELRIFATGENLLTVSNIKGGWDPETSDGGGRIYPVTRVISLGLNIKF